MKLSLFKLPPNRVRRNYRGGGGLDRIQGLSSPQDGDCPEDWLGSTVEARNPGMPDIPMEGLASVDVNGQWLFLKRSH